MSGETASEEKGSGRSWNQSEELQEEADDSTEENMTVNTQLGSYANVFKGLKAFMFILIAL